MKSLDVTLEEMEDRYMRNQFKLMSLKNAYKHGGNQAFYGSENEPEHLEGVAIQADGTPVAWVGKYTRYFSINSVNISTDGKLWISESSCGGSTAGPLNIRSINNYNTTVSKSKRIIDWIEF